MPPLLIALLAAQVPPAVLVVFPVEDRSKKVDARTLETMAEYLAGQLGGAGFSIIPRGDVRTRLDAQKAESYRACYDEACQIELGKELAANKVVATRITALGSQCLLSAFLYDLGRATSDATATAKCDCSEEALVLAIDQLVPQLAPKKRTAPAATYVLRGIVMRKLTADERRSLKLPSNIFGVLVDRVEENSGGAAAGVIAGDVITEIGVPGRRGEIARTPTRSLRDFEDVTVGDDTPVLLRVRRQREDLSVMVRRAKR